MDHTPLPLVARLAGLLVLACSIARADDWPRFLGPDGAGISAEKGLARSWPEGGPKLLWAVDVGEGYGPAAVRNGKVYLLDRVPNKQDVLRCFDLASGKEGWAYAYEAPGWMSYGGSRTAPTVEEKVVYALGPFGHLNCIDLNTHKPVWSANIVKDFLDPDQDRRVTGSMWTQTRVPRWGISQSPAVYKDTLIVAPQSETVGVVAYDKATGQIRWKSPYVGRNWFSHTSPYVTKLCGVDQVIMVANENIGKDPPARVTSVDAQTGKLLWQLVTHRPYNVPIPEPVTIGEDKLFITGGYRLGCFAIKIIHDGEKWSTQYLFKDNPECGPHVHTPILYNGRLYANSFDGFHNGPGQNSGLICMDLDGKLRWRTGPDTLFDNGGLLIADGLIYIMHGATGELSLIEPGDDGCKLLAQAKVLDKAEKDKFIWAPMALSDGKLLVRDHRQMKCLDVRTPGPAAGVPHPLASTRPIVRD